MAGFRSGTGSIALALALGSCALDLEIPPGAAISCSVADACPEGYRCEAGIGRCIANDVLYVPLQVVRGSGAVVPEVVGASATVTATFELSGAVRGEPVVELGTSPPLAFVARPAASGYLYELTLSPGAVEEGLYGVTVSAHDEHGGILSGVGLGTLTVDLTPPSLGDLSLRYAPDPLNALPAVEALRDGSTATVFFVASEPLASGASLTAACGGGDLVFSRRAGETSPTLFTFDFTLSASDTATNGTCPLIVGLTDRAGNPPPDADTGLVLAIDRTPPDETAAIALAFLKHLRVPWGALQTGRLAGGFVVAASLAPAQDPLAVDIAPQAFAQAGEDLRAAHFHAQASGGAVIASSEPTALGWQAAELRASDLSAVYVSVLDAAGNESGRVRVANTEWVATLGGKQAGSTFENPHGFETRAVWRRSRSQAGALPGGDRVGAYASESTAAVGSFRRVVADTVPHGRYAPAVTYDSVRDRVVLFGGVAPNFEELCDETAIYCSGTWEWTGARWVAIDPLDPEADGNPTPEALGEMVFDARRGRAVMIGGTNTIEIWEWDGRSWERRCDGQPASDDCGELPLPRADHALAYEADRGVTVLFGGRMPSTSDDCGNGTGVYCDDTWEYDGAALQHICGGTLPDCPDQPDPRRYASMVYDRARGVTLLYGGQAYAPTANCATSSRYCVGTFAWDGASWSRLGDSDPDGDGDPGARGQQTMIYDATRAEAVLFGGYEEIATADCRDGTLPSGGACTHRDTWVWDGQTWRWATPSVPSLDEANPFQRRQAGMVFDSGGGEALLFGGLYSPAADCPAGAPSGPYGCHFDDLWAWDGARWARRSSGDWQLDGTPDPRLEAGLAYDAGAERLVLYGGQFGNFNIVYDDTWTFDGANWSRFTGASPSPRSQHGLTYHRRRDRSLMFGGYGYLCDGIPSGSLCDTTWSFDGGTWSRLCGTGTLCSGPAARYGHGQAYFGRADHASLLVFGGVGAGGQLNDTWELDSVSNSGWVRVCDPAACASPPVRRAPSLAYDASRGVVVLFGGFWENMPDAEICVGERVDTLNPVDNCYLADAWEWNGSGWTDVTPASGPRPMGRYGANLAYDAGSGRVVLFGGQTGAQLDCGTGTHYCGDLWSWDGMAWTEIEPGDPQGDGNPSARSRAAATELNGGVALFGGTNNNPSRDLWVWDGGSSARPAHALRIELDAVGIGTGLTPTGIDVAWLGAGTSIDAAGAALWGWRDGLWQQLQSHGADGSGGCDPDDAASPCWLRWSSADATEAERMVYRPELTLDWAATPRGAGGRVESRYVEVRVRYLAP